MRGRQERRSLCGWRRRDHRHGRIRGQHLQEGCKICQLPHHAALPGRCRHRRKDRREPRRLQEHTGSDKLPARDAHPATGAGDPSRKGTAQRCGGNAQDFHHKGRGKLPQGGGSPFPRQGRHGRTGAPYRGRGTGQARNRRTGSDGKGPAQGAEPRAHLRPRD